MGDHKPGTGHDAIIFPAAAISEMYRFSFQFPDIRSGFDLAMPDSIKKIFVNSRMMGADRTFRFR